MPIVPPFSPPKCERSDCVTEWMGVRPRIKTSILSFSSCLSPSPSTRTDVIEYDYRPLVLKSSCFSFNPALGSTSSVFVYTALGVLHNKIISE